MKNIFITITFAGLSLQIGAPCSAAGKQKPNIILLMADDLGWGDVGFNGNKEIKTPNLDRMSQEGIQFTRFYTAAPLCSPTRGSILTGRHPFRFGVLAAHTGGLRQGEITLPEICKKNGYTTGFFGKWHLGWVEPEDVSTRGFYSPPWQHGFDETFATRSAVPTWNPTVTPGNFGQWGNKPGETWKGSVYVHNGKVETENLQGDDSRVMMDRALPFIKKAVEGKQPFFTCIWFHAPHEPVVAGPQYLEMYKDLQPEIKRHYFGCITALDEQVGRLRKALKDMDIEQNTMIWFCSDNGPADPMVKAGVGSAGEFRGHKHMIYEGGIRVPSLLVWPGSINPGKKIDTRMCSYDYLPTIVEMADLTFKKKANYFIDGISIKHAIDGIVMVRDTTIFTAWMRLVDDIYGRALVGEQFKILIPEQSKVPELYDLKNDPFEKTDAIKKYPEIARAMLKELSDWEESCRLSRDGKDYVY